MEETNKEAMQGLLRELTFYHTRLVEKYSQEELLKIIEQLERDKRSIKAIFNLDIFR